MAEEKVGGIDKRWWYVIGAGAAVVGYFIYRYIKNQQTISAVDAALANQPSGAQNSSTNLNPTSTSGTGAISTLSDWMQQAQSWLVSSLAADPAIAQTALQDYANGVCLDTTQYNYIDKALGQLGMPPDAPYQGLIKCPNTPAPPPKPPPPTSPFTYISNPTLAQHLLMQGYNILSGVGPIVGGLYYYPKQTTGTAPGMILSHIGTPMEVRTLQAHGYTIYTIGNAQFYNARQAVKYPIKVA